MNPLGRGQHGNMHLMLHAVKDMLVIGAFCSAHAAPITADAKQL